MAVNFNPVPHPRIAERRKAGPPKRGDEQVGFNGRFALLITTVVGTMWCAYAFAMLALVALPSALTSGPLAIVQWISQTFIQLVLLSIIMVGQNIIGKASDRRAEMTYQAEQIQRHLKAQDEALNVMLDKLQKLEAAIPSAPPDRG